MINNRNQTYFTRVVARGLQEELFGQTPSNVFQKDG
jgi:hypothetical protein